MRNKFTFLALLLCSIFSASTIKAADISGKALYQGDIARPIGYVTVILKNTDNNSIQTFKTGADGVYQFANVPNGNYILTGTTNIAGVGGTFYDAALVYLYLAKAISLSPIQLLAADVDANGKVEMKDFNLILNHILTKKAFPAGSWKFEISSFSLSGLKAVDPKGLGGTCSGDVGGTFVPTSNSLAALPVDQEGEINVTADNSFTTKILTHNNLSIKGAGLIINYPADLLQIESVEFKGADYEYNIEGGQIRLIWGNPDAAPINFNDGETFITIHGKSTAAFSEGMTASISMDGSTSLLNSSNKQESELKFATPVIKFGKPSLKLSNYPNPFKNSTTLNIYSPEAGNAIIEVYSAKGQLVKKISVGELNVGYQEVNLDASAMAKGYYICKIRIQTGNSEYTDVIRLLKAE